MKTYYNEFDKKKCAALSQIMKDGYITDGEIDDRSIKEVRPEEIKGYDRCHFFAGIGLWDYALHLAGWKENHPVWTGSCPCQPFSSAGRQRGKEDDRHLWPEWLRLIEECHPPVIFGEQVASAITKGWLDDVYQGLEAQEYAVGSIVLPASAVGAPHRRERLWFVAQSASDYDRRNTGKFSKENEQQTKERQGAACDTEPCSSSSMGNSEQDGCIAEENTREINGDARKSAERSEFSKQPSGTSTSRNVSSNVADTKDETAWGRAKQARREIFGDNSPWDSGEWIDCPDGKKRLVEPGVPLLAHGYPERVGVIHCAGDAIVPQVAAEFIMASMPI